MVAGAVCGRGTGEGDTQTRALSHKTVPFRCAAQAASPSPYLRIVLVVPGAVGPAYEAGVMTPPTGVAVVDSDTDEGVGCIPALKSFGDVHGR